MNTLTRAMVAIGVTLVVAFGMVHLNQPQEPLESKMTDEEVLQEYTRLLKEVNDTREELIELYRLRTLEIEGKLHSS